LAVVDLFVPPLLRLPDEGELIAIDDLLQDAGGCAVNTASTLTRLGFNASIAARAGTDALGDWMIEKLKSKGVDVSWVTRTDSEPTSKTVILPLVGQDRRYIHAPGANATLTVDDIEPSLDGADALIVGGFLDLPGLSPQPLAALLSRARAAGITTLLDVVIPSGSSGLSAALREVLPQVDCFLPNSGEGEAITGDSVPLAQAETFLEWGAQSVVITCGASGALYVDSDVRLFTPPFPVDFVDGSGSGDAFAAGYLAGLVNGWDVDRRMRFAAAIGASATRGLGCTTTLFSWDEALDAIERRPSALDHPISSSK
jgi:sugar/nucleoside kinase (ribokinase family)